MKTARELAEEWSGDEGETVQLTYAVLDRDGEHGAALTEQRGEYEQMLATLSKECERLKGELAEARRFILRLAERNNCGELDCGDIDCDGCAARRFLLAAPSPVESTYVRHMYSVNCSCDKCGKETELRLAPRSEPPDDIREQFVADKAYLLGQIGRVERVFAQHNESTLARLADHERRLKALEERTRCAYLFEDGVRCVDLRHHPGGHLGVGASIDRPAAPQKQAGHAFVEAGWPEPLGMTCGVSGCGRNALGPIHTGAKP